MKKIAFIIVLMFPLFTTGYFMVRVQKIDATLIFVKEALINKGDKEKLIIDKHSSKRRIYFFVKENEDTVKYERKYRGLITGWSLLLKTKVLIIVIRYLFTNIKIRFPQAKKVFLFTV